MAAPSTPYDAKGLLKTAIRDPNPVIFLEAELMYGWKGEVPEGEYLVEFGKAEKRRVGKDVTVVGFGKVMKTVLDAVPLLEESGVDAEVIDLRTIRPFDWEMVYGSVKKTNRIVIVDESWPIASVGSWIGWSVSKECFDWLDSPVEVVTMEDVPMPYNHKLELAAQPSVEKIQEAVKRVVYK